SSKWGRGARLAGTDNASELLINTVMIEVPKLLTGTNQKVRGWLLRLDIGVRRYQATGEEVGPNPVV
ncbi:hypothetical protein KC221_28650, partial [Mycobacterium tuberculosis]|nr:hypothetical protein [Mycobacterium tuberculosis]